MAQEIQIPEGVVDVTQYKVYCALKNHPVFRDTQYMCSDGNIVNIAMLPHFLAKKISHLSPKEQEDIMELKRQYNVILAKKMKAHATAFGKVGRFGGKTKEEAVAKYSLSPFQADVIELLGRMFTVGEVVKIMMTDNHIECSELEVKEILKDHLGEIEKKREEFRNKVTDVRLYNKRPRLEELAWMYSKMKQRYVALNSIDCYNALLRTLEQIRKEAEGDVLNINAALDVNVETVIRQQIEKEALKTINLKEIIIGRVAARMNYDPTKLIAGLHNSMYAKFVHISDEYDPNTSMEYPSNSPYDFAKIERDAEAHAVDISPEKIKPQEKEYADGVRAMFLAKIKKQQAEMKQRQTRWDAAEDIEADEEHPIKRGRGSGKDKNLASKAKKNAGSPTFKNKEYKIGQKK